jgi:hypothetical protein
MNEDTIYRIREYVANRGYKDVFENERPVQRPFSAWTVDELIYELKTNYELYPNEIIRNYIALMRKYEEYAEIERKNLYKTAGDTAKEIYSYLFEY